MRPVGNLKSIFIPGLEPGAGAVSPPAWAPSDLFAASEQGAWYDPSDLSTLFQDDAGTTPVTADGDPVGLMLDKSQGLVLGGQLFDGTFSAIEAWSNDGGGTWSADGTQTGNIDIRENNVTASGSRYEFSFTISGLSGGSVVAFLGYTAPVSISSSGLHTYRAVANTNFIVFRVGAGVIATISGISVKEIPGNHASQATTSKRPTYKTDGTLHWLDDDGVDDDMSATLPSIASATVAIARSTGADITYPVDLSSGSYTVDGDGYGWVIVDRALTAGETSDLTAYLDNKAGV